MYERQRKLKMVAWPTPKQMSAERRARRLQFHSLGQLSPGRRRMHAEKTTKTSRAILLKRPKTHETEKTWCSAHGIFWRSGAALHAMFGCKLGMQPQWQRFIFWLRKIETTSLGSEATSVSENAKHFIEHKFWGPLKVGPHLSQNLISAAPTIQAVL